MSSKRRLSQGSTLQDCDSNSDDDQIDAFAEVGGGRRSLATRRRSSIRSQGPPQDQARLAEMYKTIIKMSSENKINAKNSWSLNLIDHMHQIIKEDTTDRGQRGVNFQKASCTLDASIKIYSHRVDDTWSRSYQMLENLSRNGTNDENEEEDKENGGIVERGKARVGTKATSNRFGLTVTIESNKATLNAKELDCDFAADPIFHKMSQAFDEGGAKGMLMTNLRVGSKSSTLIFNSEDLNGESQSRDTADTFVSSPSSSSMCSPNESPVDIGAILLQSGIKLNDLLDITVTPALDNYRDIIGIECSTSGLCELSTFRSLDIDRMLADSGVDAASYATASATGRTSLRHSFSLSLFSSHIIPIL